MSTRAQIVITDGHDKLLFYRHSDGYPEGVMPTLEKFLTLVKEGTIRDNVEQASGWLIQIGREDMLQHQKEMDKKFNIKGGNGYAWKVGYYEPSVCIHGDIEFLYVINLVKKTINVHEDSFDEVFAGIKGGDE